MKPERRRTLLFLLCAVVLLGVGFAWGYANAYNRFYSPDAALDRELMRLDFDSRMLHHVTAGQRAECRRELMTQLQQQTVFIKSLLAEAPGNRDDARRKLAAAEANMAGSSEASAFAAPTDRR